MLLSSRGGKWILRGDDDDDVGGGGVAGHQPASPGHVVCCPFLADNPISPFSLTLTLSFDREVDGYSTWMLFQLMICCSITAASFLKFSARWLNGFREEVFPVISVPQRNERASRCFG